MQYTRLFPFSQHHALRRFACQRENRLHEQVGFVDEFGQLIDVSVKVGNWTRCHTGIHRRLRHRRGDFDDQTRVERFRNNVFRPEAQVLVAIGGGHHFALLGVRQLSNGVYRGQFHLFVDGSSADVQRAAEDEREAQNVVNLVRVVGTAGANDGVRTHLFRQRRQDFRFRVGEGQDHWRTRHLLNHFLRQHFRTRATEENVCAVNDIIQRTLTVIHHCVSRFGFRHVWFTIFVNHPFGVTDHNVVFLHTQRHQQVHTGNRRRTCTGHHHAHIRDIFLNHPQTVKDCGSTDDCRTVLVIMEYRNIHALTEFLLNVEALRRFDIFEVNAAKRWFKRRYHVDKFIRIEFINFDVEHVNPGEFLKQNAFTFHHWFTGQRANITQAQNRSTVGNNRNQVAACGVFVGCQRVLFNFKTRCSHARRVGQREVALGCQRLGRRNLDFTGYRKFVEIEGALF